MIRAVIVDDEQPSVDKMAKLLGDSGIVEICGKFNDPLEALEFLQRNRVDAVFLDIEMPEMDGIELSSRIIDLQEKVAVVFVTAYNQYAVEAFQLNALDYLMKPVAEDRLKDTLHRITERMGTREPSVSIRLQCFGRFRVLSPAGEVKFRTVKAKELLAFILDRRGAFVSRREIIDSLWEDFDGDRAIIHFNTTLHYVKKALLLYGIQIPIQYDGGSYQFDLSRVDCDYFKFHDWMENMKSRNNRDIADYEEAAQIYTGDYLADLDYGWAERKRLLVREQFIKLLICISEHYLDSGLYNKAIEHLKSGLLHEPLHRELNYKLIQALFSSGDRVMAYQYFEIYRNNLKKKLKQEPDEGFWRLLQLKNNSKKTL